MARLATRRTIHRRGRLWVRGPGHARLFPSVQPRNFPKCNFTQRWQFVKRDPRTIGSLTPSPHVPTLVLQMPKSSATPLPIPTESVQVRCPHCGSTHIAEIRTIIDASDGAARQALLSGTLNAVSCPVCGILTRADVPLLYHDAGQGIAYVLVPQASQRSHETQERAIGRLTNRVLESLPPEKRGMYLLQPLTFLTPESFVDAVLQASPVTSEAMSSARADAALVETLMGTADEETLRDALVTVGKGVDYDFLLFVTALAENAANNADPDRAQALLVLRDRLVALADISLTVDDIMNELQDAHRADRLDQAVARFRPVLDYSFFSALTQRMEQADAGTEAAALGELRAAVVAAIDRLDEAITTEVQEAVEILRTVAQAPDPAAAVQARAPDLTAAFFLVLDANVQAAAQNGDDALAAKLHAVRQAATDTIEARLSPTDRLVNRLARSTDPAERAAILDSAPELLGQKLQQTLAATAVSARNAGAGDVAQALEAAALEVDRRRKVRAPSE